MELRLMKIRQLGRKEPIPLRLLLLADPSEEMIMAYFSPNYTYIAELSNEIIGVFILYPLNDETIEIKNIAVQEDFQGKGVGTILLSYATQIARDHDFYKLVIGTADASQTALRLYQKNGFIIYDTKKNFFIDNYSIPIFDNEIECVDMIILEKYLKEKAI